jgi:hypothetical protein
VNSIFVFFLFHCYARPGSAYLSRTPRSLKERLTVLTPHANSPGVRLSISVSGVISNDVESSRILGRREISNR